MALSGLFYFFVFVFFFCLFFLHIRFVGTLLTLVFPPPRVFVVCFRNFQLPDCFLIYLSPLRFLYLSPCDINCFSFALRNETGISAHTVQIVFIPNT